ncbi:hypothetical protein D3C78_1850270 [compost metagenome]
MRWLYMLVASAALIFLFSRSMRTLMRQDPATRYRPGFLRLWHALDYLARSPAAQRAAAEAV